VGLAIANHSDEVAEVRIRGFSSESTSSSAPVPAGPTISMELNPHQQMAKFLVEYDEAFTSFQGWVEVSSFNNKTHAIFLNMPADRIAFAGSSGSSRASADLFFPQSELDPESDFQFSVINNNFEPADVGLDLIDSAGGLVDSVDIVLAPQREFSGSLSSLFPGGAGSLQNDYLRVHSTEPLSAYQQTATSLLFFGQVPTVPRTSPGKLYLPQFAAGLDPEGDKLSSMAVRPLELEAQDLSPARSLSRAMQSWLDRLSWVRQARGRS
jgi:hypothetical protein